MVSDGRLKNSYGLYIHYPFCTRLCYYCHFTKQPYNSTLSRNYIQYLQKELVLKGDKGKTIDSIYFGGGSPGLIDHQDFLALFNTISKVFTIDPGSEVTVEINPEDADLEKLSQLKNCGFNRISIGTQSFDAADLAYLCRNHSSEMSISVIQDAQRAGFQNINVDFIIGLPTQTSESLSRGFDLVRDLDVPHLSVYILEGINEENDHNISLDADFYFQAEAVLSGFGYEHYEVSNYARTNYESRHNNKYWQNQNYIGTGLSASGYEKGIDYKNTENLDEYFSLLRQEKLPIGEQQQIDPIRRCIVTGLRLKQGIDKEFFSDYRETIKMLLQEKFLLEREHRIYVNPKKMLLLNEILSYFS